MQPYACSCLPGTGHLSAHWPPLSGLLCEFWVTIRWFHLDSPSITVSVSLYWDLWEKDGPASCARGVEAQDKQCRCACYPHCTRQASKDLQHEPLSSSLFSFGIWPALSHLYFWTNSLLTVLYVICTRCEDVWGGLNITPRFISMSQMSVVSFRTFISRTGRILCTSQGSLFKAQSVEAYAWHISVPSAHILPFHAPWVSTTGAMQDPVDISC